MNGSSSSQEIQNSRSIIHARAYHIDEIKNVVFGVVEQPKVEKELNELFNAEEIEIEEIQKNKSKQNQKDKPKQNQKDISDKENN